jgi:hypothetical protein
MVGNADMLQSCGVIHKHSCREDDAGVAGAFVTLSLEQVLVTEMDYIRTSSLVSCKKFFLRIMQY